LPRVPRERVFERILLPLPAQDGLRPCLTRARRNAAVTASTASRSRRGWRTASAHPDPTFCGATAQLAGACRDGHRHPAPGTGPHPFAGSSDNANSSCGASLCSEQNNVGRSCH
jgi:hypothetical protein